ncbi:outer membrane lipoprotein SlyB [Mesoflavibacter sabulilitoris]|uniref:Glycine zipper domain-containing protein n=1 Tax=Mesoflavibacter zeaxanthinifaciens subsp. sabulilitoris TaxID=1520893 RepID=A0A2T1N6G0_9FLAO|nr:hypothetical protein [Mesoflavibacter zeaxanthinifaciens]MBB3123303.1 outer membrane lipoprotein SlyB [Mesoflavibacter zeaxanthinifaciens subsp. sabulilitoris]PSG87060.1 hypothetical protein C7H61_13195 [Mesoflavibacter zeaxanthinifaciens subsp. sabulilitoris]
MKLYVKKGKQKIYLRHSAQNRSELARKIGGYYFTINGFNYNVNQVFAEKESSNTVAGGVIGGAIGLFGGPIGFLTGALVGGLIGNSSESKEEKEVNYFNRSRL